MQIDKESFKNIMKRRLHTYVIEVISLIDSCSPGITTNVLTRQLVKSSTSILTNFVEGQSSSSAKELARYLEIALKSANESRVWFELLRDTHKIDMPKAEHLLTETDEIAKIIASSVLKLKKRI